MKFLFIAVCAIAIFSKSSDAFVPRMLPTNALIRSNALEPLAGVKIVCTDSEPIENILRRFKKGVSQSSHLIELRFKEFHESNHDKRKRKRERSKVLDKIERTNDKYERRYDGTEYNS